MLTRLRERLALDGLNIVLPISAPTLERELAAVSGPPLADLLAGACGAFVIGDGGPSFFAGFAARGLLPIVPDGKTVSEPGGEPLDDYTRACVARAVDAALSPQGKALRHRIVYPFEQVGAVPLPFQRLGRAAGLPAAGPLGLQIHPQFGPWWAYRALVIVAGVGTTIEDEPPLAASCDACPAPCAVACPGHAPVPGGGFLVGRCVSHRLAHAECALGCAARSACPVGEGHRYPDGQLAFHMTASLVQVRRWAARRTSA